jgi:hypothetical protein
MSAYSTLRYQLEGNLKKGIACQEIRDFCAHHDISLVEYLSDAVVLRGNVSAIASYLISRVIHKASRKAALALGKNMLETDPAPEQEQQFLDNLMSVAASLAWDEEQHGQRFDKLTPTDREVAINRFKAKLGL